MATICNMGAEVGATTSLFPFSTSHEAYLIATHRKGVAEQARSIVSLPENENLLVPDHMCEYDRVIKINLSNLEPHINGPFTPDLSTPLSEFSAAVKANNWPSKINAGLIGSCTNSSYEDMTRAEHLVKQASAAGLTPKADFFVTPGSEQIRATLDRDHTLSTFSSAGGTVLANACGPCIGQWRRTDEVEKGETNAIFSSYNRNFPARNDGNRQTMNFLASPEVVTAMTFAGSTTFNPLKDEIQTPTGESFRFIPPKGDTLPSLGFAEGKTVLDPTFGVANSSVDVIVNPSSSRLALLQPFLPYPGSELNELRVLIKIKGQCTTDTISAAGPWLKYKGHLPNISENTLIGAVNAGTGETNVAYDVDGTALTIPELAKTWKARGQDWIIVAEHNYGEGSAREHAALQPRYLGCRIILAKSFARIHETNLKKQGIVPLTFANEEDYNLLKGCDLVKTKNLLGVLNQKGNENCTILATNENGEEIEIETKNNLSADQCDFIIAGSALNLLAKRVREER